MTAIREIIRPSSQYYNLHLPKEYVNQDIEIIIIPTSNIQSNNNKSYKTAFKPQEFYGLGTQSKKEIDKYLADIKSEWK